MADLLLTGLPRSGSAAVSALIDSSMNAVCLNTPPWQAAFARQPLDILPFCKWLVGDFAWARRQLLNGAAIADIRAADGLPLMDGLHDPRMQRGEDGEPKAVSFIRHNLTADFTLAMRQTTLFTSVLPQIAAFGHFSIIAVIRHPVELCLSWRRMPQPLLSQGNPPGIARYWPQALEALAGGSLTGQFVALYEMHVQRYHECGATILRYEDVLADPACVNRLVRGQGLGAAAARLQAPKHRQDAETYESISKAFRKESVYAKLYYPDI